MVTQVLQRSDRRSARPAIVDAAAVASARADTLAPYVRSALAAIFSALGEPTRLCIIQALARTELCVGDLATVLGLAVPAVSQHLRLLRTLRIVRSRRAGKLVYYALDDAHVAALFAVALAHVRGDDA